MTNKLLTALRDVGTVLAWPFVHASRTIAILTITLKDYPAVRTAVIGLVQQITTAATDIEAALSQGEINLADDEAEIKAAVALYRYAKLTFLPAIEAAYNDEISAATATAQQTAAQAAAASAAATKAAATRKANAAATPTTAATDSPAATS
jgi:hypothetical protein